MEIDKYYFPFDTNKHPVKISQGNNGPWSHKVFEKHFPGGQVVQRDFSYAVDFALPVGTEVKAARDGEISLFMLRSTKCYEGLDPEIGNSPQVNKTTNWMTISHEDGSRDWYSHLGTKLLVKTRQRVKAGEVIAVTGKSGWIAEIPHLHFHVDMAWPSTFEGTIPITFEDYLGSLDHETLATEGKIWFGEK